MHEKRLAARYFMLSFALGFLALAVAAMLAVLLVPPKMRENAAQRREQEGAYLPTDADAMNILLILTGGGDEELFALLRFDPMRGQIPVAVLPAGTLTGEQGRMTTLEGLYDYAGAQNVQTQLGAGLGVAVDRYARLDSGAAARIIDQLGGVRYRLREPVTLDNGPARAEMRAGNYQLSGSLFCELLFYPGYSGGEAARLDRAGGLIASLINEHFSLVTTGEMDTVFQKFANLASTDISVVDYQRHLPPARFMCQLTRDPAFAVKVRGETDLSRGTYTLSAPTREQLADIYSPVGAAAEH